LINPAVDHKAIDRGVDVPEFRVGQASCIDRVESGLAGIQEVLKVEEQGKMFTDALFGHQARIPVGITRAAVPQFLRAEIVGLQPDPEVAVFFVHQHVVEPVSGRQREFRTLLS